MILKLVEGWNICSLIFKTIRYDEKKPDVLGFMYECERTRIFKTCIFVVPRTAEIVFDINGLMEKCKQKFSN